MIKTGSIPKLFRIAAWYSFLGPLAAAGFFVAWNHEGLLEWIPSGFLEVLLVGVVSSAGRFTKS